MSKPSPILLFSKMHCNNCCPTSLLQPYTTDNVNLTVRLFQIENSALNSCTKKRERKYQTWGSRQDFQWQTTLFCAKDGKEEDDWD